MLQLLPHTSCHTRNASRAVQGRSSTSTRQGQGDWSTQQTLHNMDEAEAASFDEEFQSLTGHSAAGAQRPGQPRPGQRRLGNM